MKRLLLPLLFCLPLIAVGQNGIIGTGFANGWTNPNDVLGFSESAGSSRIITLTPNGTGDQFFRFVRFMNFDNSEFGPFGCTDADWSGNEGVTYFDMPICGSGAFYINCPNTTDNYIFKTSDALDNDFVFFRVQGDIRTVTDVSDPMGDVAEGTTYEVTATTDDALNTGQGIFLRYSTDGFASSTIVAMTESMSLAPTNYVATIPGQTAGTTVSYYVFTSGDLGGVDPNNADWFTINLNNNGGSNFSYLVTAPVPVSLSQFEASIQDEGVLLEWSTESEVGNDYFAIERSVDGKRWSTIGQVMGQGTVWTAQDYQFLDRSAVIGSNFYRLRQVDFSGIATWSPTRIIDWKMTKKFSFFPNPASDHVNVRIEGLEEEWNLALYNAQGQLLQNLSGDTQQDLSLLELPSGVYFLQLRGAQGQVFQQERLIKR